MKDNMKLYELTINENGIRFRHCNPNPLTAEQKFNIVMALVGLTAFLVFFGQDRKSVV